MENLWTQCLEDLKNLLGKTSFESWIANLHLKKFSPQILVLEAPNAFFKEWIEENYVDKIKDVLSQRGLNNIELNIEVNTSLLKNKTTKIFRSIDKELLEDSADSFKLNPRFTFENFVVGPSNRMAHAASLAVSNAPGQSYNPLFIYGGVGLGKTHLMQAIAHSILQKYPQLKIRYLSTEKFTNELIYSIQNRTTQRFRNKYREIDVLLIDDVQFLAGKEGVQEEFFHTFNVLYDYHKQIVISSDRHPREIPQLKERIVSRFSWGLVIDIQPPDLETRMAILKKKLENLEKQIEDTEKKKISVPINDEVLFFIAENITTNIRELEGALHRVIAYSIIENKKITLEIAKDILKDMVKEVKAKVTPELILICVSNFFKVKPEDLKSNRRSKQIILPKQILMYLLRSLTDLSFPEIGNFLGAKHHTTILYAYKKMEERLEKEEKLKSIIDSITQEIKNHK